MERIPAQGSVSFWWDMHTLGSEQAFCDRLFWTDYIWNEAHRPLLEGLNSDYLHQALCRGERGSPAFGSLPYSLCLTSVGNITLIKKQYGVHLEVGDIAMQAGFYAASEAHYEHPEVPPSVVDSGKPGEMWVHAYTVFGRLRLTGEYYGYSEAYASLYYDEVVRLLTLIGSEVGEYDELKVGDVLNLEPF